MANSAQSSFCVIQGNLSGSYYTPLTLNAQGGTVFVNKFPSAGVTGSNLDVNGRIDCTNLYLNNRDISSTLPNTFFITSPEVDSFNFAAGDLAITFNTPSLNRGAFTLVSNNQIKCLTAGTYLFTLCISSVTQSGNSISPDPVFS